MTERVASTVRGSARHGPPASSSEEFFACASVPPINQFQDQRVIENGEAADAWNWRAQRRSIASLSGGRPHSHGATTPCGCDRT
jgi:hypothetical protein